MVMSLQNHIYIIFVKYRRQLSTEDHTVCIGMIQTGSVNILMDRNNTPLCIREILYRLFNGLLMFCHIVIIRI